MKTIITLALVALVASFASANVSTWTGTGWADYDYNTDADTNFQWGSIGRHMASDAADWELGMGTTVQYSDTTTSHIWQNGVAQAFSLSYDGAGTATWTVGNDLVQMSLGSRVTDLYLQLRCPTGGVIGVSDVVLNVGGVDNAIGSLTATGDDKQWIGMQYQDAVMSDSTWTLSGNVIPSWTGDAPTRSNMFMAVQAVNDTNFVPEPATIAMLGLGALGLIRRKRTA